MPFLPDESDMKPLGEPREIVADTDSRDEIAIKVISSRLYLVIAMPCGPAQAPERILCESI